MASRQRISLNSFSLPSPLCSKCQEGFRRLFLGEDGGVQAARLALFRCSSWAHIKGVFRGVAGIVVNPLSGILGPSSSQHRHPAALIDLLAPWLSIKSYREFSRVDHQNHVKVDNNEKTRRHKKERREQRRPHPNVGRGVYPLDFLRSYGHFPV